MSNQNLVLISFNRDQLQMVDRDGQPYVVMKPIVKALKMKWETQRIKLVENQKKFNYQVLICTPPISGADDQRREMGCIPLKKLNGWLFSINANNIPNLETRSKVEKYQEECFEVLWNYWLNKSKSPLELLMEAKFKMENEPVNSMSFEQISYSERLAQRRFTWREFQEFFGMKTDNYFLRVIVGIINRQVLGMSAGNFRRQVLGPQRVRIVNGERVRLDVMTNNRPINLTKDFLPKPHQECIQRVMQDLFEYYMARPNWNRADVRIKVKEFILTRKSSIERIIGRPLHTLVLECIQQVSMYSEANNVSPYDVIQNNLVQLNYNQLALERDIRQHLQTF